MKNRILPCLLLALAAATFARAQQDYYLLGSDTGTSCSLNAANGPKGWATTPGGTRVTQKVSDPDGFYHIYGNVLRIQSTAAGLGFYAARLVFDGTNPAINDKYSENVDMPLHNIYVPTGIAGEIRNGDNSKTKIVSGTNWVIQAGGTLLLNIGEDAGYFRYIVCSATVTGEGTFGAAAGIDDSRGVASTGNGSKGTVTLTGDLSGFAGRLTAGERGITYPGLAQTTANANLKLVIGAEQAMPQSSPGVALLRGATVVTNGATISFACDATSPTNRGWTFGSGAVPKVEVASGKTATIEGPVEGTVGFIKTGPGTLVLNVGGAGEYGTLTLEGEQTVSAAQLADYVAACEDWIAGRPVFGAVSQGDPSETSAPFSVEVKTSGRDAATAELLAIVREPGEDPREVPLATLSVPTNGVFAVGGLEPDKAYQVEIVLSNAAAAVTNGPYAVTTPVANPAPTATLSLARAWAAAADLTVAVPRFGYGATSISSLLLRWGTDPADESSWTTTNLVPPAAEGGSVSCRLLGLATGTTYYAKVFAENDLDPAETFETARLTFAPVTPPLVAEVSTEGGNATTTILADGSTVLHFLSDGAFTLADDTEARILLVGGGGAGGSNCGGGGGAGGMLEIDSETLAAGTYGVTVGAGGQPVSGARGGNGGNTLLSFGGEDKHVAVGGGGGACWNGKTGGAGGSGGGGSQSGAGGAGTAGQGNVGGGTNVSGGGGAGSAGSAGGARGSKAGNGGVGRASDITGEEVWYAGGGGGGGWGDANKGPEGGDGGDGGGGNGARNVYVVTRQAAELADGRNEYAAEAGVDGLGGGGGGGNNTGESAPYVSYFGRPGGSGTLVVRLAGLPSGGIDESQPRVKVSSVDSAVEALRVSARVSWTGFGSETTRVLYRVAATEECLASAPDVVAYESLAAGADASFLATNLPAGERRYVRVFAENDLGIRTESAVFSAFPCGDTMTATAVGASRTFDVGQDRVAVFTNSAETATFTTAEGGYVELLLVGGGGSGGSFVGGGGGGGGFLHLENAYLAPGTYEIAVGAGGAQTTTSSYPGNDGGNTTLRRQGESDALYVAHGGGGGGGNNTAAQRAGRAGGSGGGAGNQSVAGGTSTAVDGERGNPGGGNTAENKSVSLASGGGGAGASGSHADYGTGIGGAGGAGLPCSITGEEVWYAGGGGAGQESNSINIGGVSLVYTAGLGGRGGGGKGCSTADNVIDDYERGADGFGGGGGGGRRDGTNEAGKPRLGAPGGSGTLIVRWKATSDSTARATIDAVTGSSFSALVSGTVELAGAAGATIEMAVGPSGGTLGAWTALGTVAEPGAFSFVLPGLAANTEYDYEIRVVSGAAEGEALGAASGSFRTPVSTSLALAGDPEGAVQTRAGIDTAYTFPTAGVYSVSVQQGGPARLLLVGGGGAGGTRRGGGGGAGGFLEYGSYLLEAGEYVVEVGAGGEPSPVRDVPGGNGGPTVLWRVVGSETNQVLVAQGGGGGGCYYLDENHAGLPGNPGGSGGGGGPKNNTSAGASTAVVPELGNAGGSGLTGTSGGGNSASGGGGGAGGPGGDGVGNDQNAGPNRRQGGAGGAGVSSDITGATRWYAGGGGGSVWYDKNGGYKGLGGRGGGGDGGGYTVETNLLLTACTPGEDGTGSGGGGGWAFDKCEVADEIGAAGGCGTFVLRVPGFSFSGLPDPAIESLEPDDGDATAVRGFVALRSAGADGTATLSLAYGLEPDSLALSVPVASDAAAGAYAVAVSGLAPGSTWHFAPVASNSRGAVTGAVVAVTLPAAPAAPAGEGPGGLWQAQRRFADAASMRAAFADAALWSGLGNSNLVSGTLAADSSSATFVDPVTGLAFAWPGAPSLFAYRGWIYLEGGKTYVFGARFADCVHLSVDGSVLLSAVGVVKADQSGTFAAEESGWYEIDARVGRTGSTFGPDGDGRTSWSSFGLAFNASGTTDPIPESAWTRLLDDGSGTLLRPSRPAARSLALVSQAVENGSLSLAARVGAGENAARAWLVYGNEDAGTASIADWEHSTDLGEVAASAEAADLAASVAGWGSAATVARLVLETEGLLAWTEPATFSETATPSVLDASATGFVSGESVTFRATVAGGSAPYTATLMLGTEPTALSAAGSASVPSAGPFTMEKTGLALGTVYWWRLEVRDARGVVARTETRSFAVPTESRLFDRSDGDGNAYLAANPFTTDQNTVVFGGTLVDLGAGETTVWLLRDQRFTETFPGYAGTQFHEGEQRIVDSAGRFDLTVADLDWDADISWNWAVSNATSTASWGPTAKARDLDFWRCDTVILDVSDYTWEGGAAGTSWTNAASWQTDGLHTSYAGFPRRGSGAVFPAGETAVVSVPDFPTALRFSQLSIGAGADVTFVPDPAASAPALTMQKEPRTANTTSTPRDYSFSLGEGATLRFKGEGLSFNFRNDPGYQASAANIAIEVADGASVTIGSSSTGAGYTQANQAGSRLVVTNGATLSVNGYLVSSGAGSQIVVDDATLVQTYAANNGSRVYLRGASMGGRASLVLRGANPVFQAGCYFTIDKTGDKLQYVDFEVPEGGWSAAPIRTSPDNTTAFGYWSDLSEAGRRILLRIPTNCPAALAGETLDVPLVRWPKGVYTNAVVLSADNLPHPETDYFYLAPDTATGQTNLMAHLVGWADTDAPQIAGVRLSAMAPGSATVSFTAIPGRDGGAFLQTTVSAEVLDAAGDSVAGVSAVPDPGSFSGAGAGTVSLSGLAENASYTLRLTLSDGTHDPVSEDFAFAAAGDYGEGSSATADSTVEDGPFTVWIFTNTTASAQSLTVTKAGWADVLVVGGGGSGGGGSQWNCGGGGGGGGQVVATNLFLLPGVYDVAVGAGGGRPEWTRERPGSAGKRSGFAGINAAGGGYGSSNNSSAGGTGANGGGGSGTNKAGGSGTAGCPGGKGANAGGGGGGAGGAGGNASGSVGGDGGAGAESDISGERRVYGAGGGGGAGQSTGTAGGAPGGPTAGAGPANTAAWRDPAKVETMNAAPGFGGGGGGGTSGNEAMQNAGAMWGGLGGCGTVVVRMRTATAHDPAPQAAFKGAEAGVSSVDLTLSVFTLGEGAPGPATATLRVAEAGSATTNVFEMGFVEAPGWTNLVARNLRPATSYAGVVRLENGLEGGVLDLPVSFETEPETGVGTAFGAAWTYGQWSGTAADFDAGNVLRGTVPEVTVASSGAASSITYQSGLCDGLFGDSDKGSQVSADLLLSWRWAEPVWLGALRLFYSGNDGRSYVGVASVEVLGADGTWSALESGPGHYNEKTGSNYGFLLPATDAGVLWSEPVYGIRFTSDAFGYNSWHRIREIEVAAASPETFPADLSVLSATRTTARLSAAVGFSRPLPAAADVTAYLASDYGAEDLSAWTAAATTNVPAGATSRNFAIPAGDLDGKVYLRFRYVDANGVSRWSESVYLPDIPEVASLPPVVAWSATVATAPDGATLAANLVDAGTGAVGGVADLSVRCALRTNDVDGASAVVLPFADGAPEGETEAAVSGLMPARTYHARFVAENAEGGDAGTGVSDLFSFTTDQEDFGFPPASASNRWVTNTWTTASIRLEDNLLRGKTPVVEKAGIGDADLSDLTDGLVGTAGNSGPGPGAVLRFELGGTYALSEFRVYTQWSDSRATVSVALLEWRDERGVWHAIPDSAVNYGKSNSRYYAFLRPADGDEYLAVGATAFRYTQGTGGYAGFHPTREMELFGDADVGRILDVTDRSWSGGTLSATVVRPVATAFGRIRAASAAGYHGAEAAAWAANGAVASFGDLSVGVTGATGSVTPVSGARYVRFYEEDASGKIVAWSPAVSTDPAAVAIADLGVVHAGDGAVATARVDATGLGGFSLVLEYGREPDLSDATATNVTDAVSGGRASVFFRTVPGGTYHYRFVATADGGGYDATPVASFTTLAGSLLRSNASYSGLAHHSVTLNGFLDVLGAGETAVELWTGPSPDALERFDSRTLDYVGAFSFAETFAGAPRQIWYAFRSVNEGLGGTVWESWSATNSFTTLDQATYTWNAEFAKGDWADPGKWIVSGITDPSDCIGFPNNAGATVVFTANTVAEVSVNGSYEFGTLSTGVNYVDVTFVGRGPDVSGLKGDFAGNGVKGATWTFSALTFEEKNGITFGGGNDKKSVDSTLRFTDGTVATSGWYQNGSFDVYGSNMWIVVDGGASLTFKNSGFGFRNGGRDGGLLIDEGTVSGSIVRTDYNWDDTTNQWFLVSGAAPRIDVSASFRNDSATGASTQNADTFFRFSVPEDGWARAPIYSLAATEKFAALLGTAGGRYVFSIDPKSPMLNTGRTRTVPLVAWINGVDDANVAFDESTHGVEFVLTYGWPSRPKDHPAANEYPTGIAAILRGHGGTMLIFR